MKITLLTKTPKFLDVIFTAARTCYSELPPSMIYDDVERGNESQERMLKLIRGIINSGHHSVIEHATFTFAVDGVSRALLAQFTRHRIGMSYSVQSQRYVSFKGNNVFANVEPDALRGNDVAAQVFEETITDIQAAYNKLIDLGIKKEDARFLLPNAACTNILTTMNLRSFINLYRLRTARGAQWEIKKMVIEMRNLLVDEEPWLAEFLPLPDLI